LAMSIGGSGGDSGTTVSGSLASDDSIGITVGGAGGAGGSGAQLCVYGQKGLSWRGGGACVPNP
jgi:hypothetical protein